jgi:methyl-accepting chemotaxis protein
VSPSHDLEQVLAIAQRLLPEAEFTGCTTAGEITERGPTHRGVAVMLMSTDDLIEVQFSTGLDATSDTAAASLCQNFGALQASARARLLPESTTVVLVDGLCGAGEHLVTTLRQSTRSFQQIVGGAAGDNGEFQATRVGARGTAAVNAAAAVHFFGRRPWGVGVDHGLRPTTKKMVVTRAEGNVVVELDGRPAFDVYREHADANGISLTPENASTYLIGNELGVFFFDELRKARAPLSVREDGALTCAASIPEGSSVCILDGEEQSMIDAAIRAAEEAQRNLRGHEAAGILLFDCVCRGMILGDNFGREIEGVRGVFPDVPIAGFLTYGEIARYKGNLDGWHNTTAVVVAIPK